MAPRPNFLISCSSGIATTACRNEAVGAINHARRAEGLPALRINLAAFDKLSAGDQVFVLSNLERTARHLPPISALTAQLNKAAQVGDAKSSNPQFNCLVLVGGKSVTSWVNNWAGGLSVLGADYFWMYDDGVGFNLGCTATTSAGCWAHRDNVLFAAPSTSSCAGQGGRPELLMGAAVDPAMYHGTTGIAQLIVTSCGGLPSDTTFTWAAAKHLVFAKAET